MCARRFGRWMPTFPSRAFTPRITTTRSRSREPHSPWSCSAIAAAIALLLGIVGLYGVIAYSASQRTREIGIRIALGAQRNTITSMFVRQGLAAGRVRHRMRIAAWPLQRPVAQVTALPRQPRGSRHLRAGVYLFVRSGLSSQLHPLETDVEGESRGRIARGIGMLRLAKREAVQLATADFLRRNVLHLAGNEINGALHLFSSRSKTISEPPAFAGSFRGWSFRSRRQSRSWYRIWPPRSSP